MVSVGDVSRALGAVVDTLATASTSIATAVEAWEDCGQALAVLEGSSDDDVQQVLAAHSEQVHTLTDVTQRLASCMATIQRYRARNLGVDGDAAPTSQPDRDAAPGSRKVAEGARTQRPRHPKKDLEEVLRTAEAAGWLVEKGKGYYLAWCPCGNHKTTIHLTPSNRHHGNQKLRLMRRTDCWKEPEP
jgi:hypothetical protein